MSKEMRERIDNFKKFLNKNDNNTEIQLYESNLSRIWQHIQGDNRFGVVSPFRKNYSIKENLERYSELKKIVRNELNLGYIELEGGFKEEGDWVTEKSLFIPNIRKTDIIKLGELFEQYSVIYKDSDEFIEIGTNEISGIGKVLTNFIKQGWDKNIQINSDLTKKFFSRLVKGNHQDSKFLFNIEELYLLEMDEKSFNEMYGESFGKKKQKRYIRLL
jgi:hypothetical protein